MRTVPKSDSKLFSLYLRMREAQAIEKLIAHVHSLSPDARSQWMEDHSEMLFQSFEIFMENSSEALSDIQLEEETLALSAQLVTALREASQELETMLDLEYSQLES